MRKAALQNKMALNTFTALQSGASTIIQTERCVFVPSESAHVSSLLNHMRTQVNALSDPTSSLGDLINRWFRSWGFWWKKLLLISRIIILICVFSCMCLYCCCRICHQGSQIAVKQATSMLLKHLTDAQGTLWRRGICDIVRAGHQGGVLEEVI